MTQEAKLRQTNRRLFFTFCLLRWKMGPGLAAGDAVNQFIPGTDARTVDSGSTSAVTASIDYVGRGYEYRRVAP
jgi:hypothetical protein